MYTVKELLNKFNDLQQGYNKRQSEYPDVSMYTQAVQEEKIALHLESGVKLYKPQFESLLSTTDNLMRVKFAELSKLKFPLRHSDNSNERLIGEQKTTNARLLFNQFKETPETLLNEVETMIQLGDLDSANSLLDLIFLNAGNEIESQAQPGFKELRNNLNDKIGITTVQKDIHTLQLLRKQVISVIEALTGNIPYVLFSNQINEMSDQEYFELSNRLNSLFPEKTVSQIRTFTQSN